MPYNVMILSHNIADVSRRGTYLIDAAAMSMSHATRHLKPELSVICGHLLP